MNDPASTNLTEQFWNNLLTSELTLWCVGLGSAALIGLGLVIVVLHRVHRPLPAANPLTDSDGTATIEFTLVMPILIFFMLLLAQVTFAMAGNIFINYSAFAATRTAIVQIPADYADDGPNHYSAYEGHTKHELIRRAALVSLVPVAGREPSSEASNEATQFVDGLSAFYQAYGRGGPNWIDSLAADRFRYAYDNTAITVYRAQEVEDHTWEFEPIETTHPFDGRDPITVRVTHRLNLGVPYVGRLFNSEPNPESPGRYTLVSAQFTLTNEGKRDELPPQPNVPRQTP